MSVSDSIADFITVIRNAIQAKKETVTLPTSRVKTEIVNILKKEKFIKDYKVIEDGNKRSVRVHLKYLKGNRPAINDLKRISRPSLRRYVDVKKIPRVLSGLGVVILSTSKGVITGEEARKQNIGGEVICKVW